MKQHLRLSRTKSLFGEATDRTSERTTQPRQGPHLPSKGSNRHLTGSSKTSDVKWDDVAGLENAREALEEAAIMPNKFPQFFKGKCRPCSGILLYGPPGTGKSYVAKALAAKADATFFNVPATELESEWPETIEKLVSALFEMARASSRAIVFFDKVDSLFSANGDNKNEVARRIKDQILIEMEALEDATDSRVLVIGTANSPYMLNRALLCRFSRRFYTALPEAAARRRMFKIHLGSTPNTLGDKDFEELAEMTEGFSGFDISAVVKDALMQPLRFARQATHFRQIPGDYSARYMPCEQTAAGAMHMNLQYCEEHDIGDQVVPPLISMKDFKTVLARAKPTVRKSDLEVFERFTAEFGEEG